MSREIRFRAYHPDYGMCGPSPEGPAFGKRDFWPFGIEVGFSHSPEDIEEWKIMQFTGLKDKNGREIYEGDVVKNGDIGVVRFGEHEAEIFRPVGWYLDVPGNAHNEPLCAACGEVIGNIYENPELLRDGG